MTVFDDGKELLLILYKQHKDWGNLPAYKELINKTGWDNKRLGIATEYLKGKQWIETIKMADGHYIIRKLTPSGIDVVEDKSKFKRHFAHEVNLGIYKARWGAEER